MRRSVSDLQPSNAALRLVCGFEDAVTLGVFLVRDRVTVPLKQNEFDALISFASSIPAARFNPLACSLLRRLNQGDYTAPAHSSHGFLCWRKDHRNEIVPGLLRRRKAERALWLGEGLEAALKHLL